MILTVACSCGGSRRVPAGIPSHDLLCHRPGQRWLDEQVGKSGALGVVLAACGRRGPAARVAAALQVPAAHVNLRDDTGYLADHPQVRRWQLALAARMLGDTLVTRALGTGPSHPRLRLLLEWPPEPGLAVHRPGQPPVVLQSAGDGLPEVAGPVVILLDHTRPAAAPEASPAPAHALALGLALGLRQRDDAGEVFYVCRHVRVAAPGLEQTYRRAREAGVIFLRTDAPPVLESLEDGGGWRLRVREDGWDWTVAAAALVLEAEPNPSRVEQLPPGLRMDAPGQLPSGQVHLGLLDTNLTGVVAVGHDPDCLAPVADQKLAASTRLRMPGVTAAAAIDSARCARCLSCLRLCPHGAIGLERGRPAVEAGLCRACSICAAVCPALAARPAWGLRPVGWASGAGPAAAGPVVLLACANSALEALAAGGQAQAAWSGQVLPVEVPCAGSLDRYSVLAALASGAAGVVLAGCLPGACRHLDGAARAERTLELVRAELQAAGLEPERVQLVYGVPAGWVEFGARLQAALGRLPARRPEMGGVAS